MGCLMNFHTDSNGERQLHIGKYVIPCKALRAVFSIEMNNVQRVILINAFTGCGLINAKNAVLLWETVRVEAKLIGN